MSTTRSADVLAEAAQSYYIDGKTQGQVAEQLHTTRSNVSRMLRAAREQGIVRIRVVHPLGRHRTLERTLAEAFPGVREVLVLAADHGLDAADPVDDLDLVGRLAASWVEGNVTDGQQLIVSWGTTLRATVQAVEAERAVDVRVGQIGGDLQVDPVLSGHELVRQLAAKLGGAYDYLHAPALCSSRAVADELRGCATIAEELDRAARADVALVGIGVFGHGFSAQLLDSAQLDDRDCADLQRLQPVGDIGARFFDEEGRALRGPFDERVLAIDLEQLRRIPTVVGVAAGRAKAPAILAALRGGLLDVLVCDQAAAAWVAHAARCDGCEREAAA